MRSSFRLAPATGAILAALCAAAPLRPQADATPAPRAESDSAFVRAHYTRQQFRIAMRDGVRLFTFVYVPDDASAGTTYPIVMLRTPYSVAPYDDGAMPTMLGPDPFMLREKYIFVYQDVRGRYGSEGEFENVRPLRSAAQRAASPKSTDEATDAYDTIDWLVRNLPFTNRRVGLWGISYPGFYAALGALSGHPALVAVSPQAPVTDFFFEDFHHNGALTQAYFYAYPIFGIPSGGPRTDDWWLPALVEAGRNDDYAFQLGLGPLRNVTARYYGKDLLWRQIVRHPNYDAFWQARAVPPRLTNVKPAIMSVGGWFDAEDLVGPLDVYKAIERGSPGANNTIVEGPFRHGGWARRDVVHTVHGDIYFGDSLETKYQRDVEAKFFHHWLKGPADGHTGLPDALMFDTGLKRWKGFDRWPAANAVTRSYYFHADGSLGTRPPTAAGAYLQYVSDPAKPVPSRCAGQTIEELTLYRYMSDDQRCFTTRPDVLTFTTDTLRDDVTIGGEITAALQVATTGSDADFVVKLIDVYPENEPDSPFIPSSEVHYAGYAQLVRGEIMRARFRRSFAAPVPLRPNRPDSVTFRLPDVFHTFRKGHRIMVQVQSSWFPAFDRNPQTYVPNVYEAAASDFVKATERVYVARERASHLTVQVLP